MGTEPRLGSKVFYKIGEVSQLTKLPAYVLRFWESQCTFLKPKKSRGNQRLYVQRDVETVLEIKRMLYEEDIPSMVLSDIGYAVDELLRVGCLQERSLKS